MGGSTQINLVRKMLMSLRDHKFHSEYAHSSMVDHRWGGGGGAPYFAPASNSRVNRERESGASQSLRFSQMRSEMRLCLFLQKETFPILNPGSICLLCFQPNCEKAFFSELTAGRYKVEI